jgi:hypothetical protein
VTSKVLKENILTQNLWKIFHNSQNEILRCYSSANYNPAPEGVQVCSLSNASMDVHIGSSPPRSDGATAARASTTLTGQFALEVGVLDARSLMSASGAKVTPDSALQIVPADLPSSSHALAPHALGLPPFLSNLQVSRSFALCCTC